MSWAHFKAKKNVIVDSLEIVRLPMEAIESFVTS